MSMKQWKNPLLLLLTAFIWGVAFVAQSVGMQYIGPYTFNCVRSIIGGLVLIPCIWFLNSLKKKETRKQETKEQESTKTLIKGGICCGIVLCVATNLQQFGMLHTSVGKAGFLTALYIIIVPLLGLFLRKKCGIQVWFGVLLALIGFYLLSVTESFTLEAADLYLLGSAFTFSLHILVIDYFTVRADGVKMSCIQFWVSGILSGIAMFLFESPEIGKILEAWLPILYAGALSSGVAYTLQIVGQKNFNPTIASLILSLESVFSALAGWAILNQKLSPREMKGCILIFIAIILAQLPGRKKAERESV